jgi:hypothetical protein
VKLAVILLILFFAGCSYVPSSPTYREFYVHSSYSPTTPSFTESDYYIVFLVEARHLDYTEPASFLRTLAKHPSDGSMNGDVGHAWIYLKGDKIIEGGQSGETGEYQPRYWEGVLENVALGAENPAAYLFCDQCDGFFQKGNGGHYPTFAAKFNISREGYLKIEEFIRSYPFQFYSLTKRQCASFLREIGEIFGIVLEDEVELAIPQSMIVQGREVVLWRNRKYQTLRFSSPDKLEMSLIKLVREGRGEAALAWYNGICECKNRRPPCSWSSWERYLFTSSVKAGLSREQPIE